jgi:hypothetical protein
MAETYIHVRPENPPEMRIATPMGFKIKERKAFRRPSTTRHIHTIPIYETERPNNEDAQNN